MGYITGWIVVGIITLGIYNYLNFLLVRKSVLL